MPHTQAAAARPGAARGTPLLPRPAVGLVRPALQPPATRPARAGRHRNRTAAAADAPPTAVKPPPLPFRRPPPKEPLPARLLSSFLGTSTVPYSSYVPEPVTLLHRVHARAKLLLLVATLLLSARSPPPARAALAATVALVTAGTLPARLSRPQLTRVAKVAAFLFVLTAIGAEGVPPVLQPRGAPADLVGLGGAAPVTPLRAVVAGGGGGGGVVAALARATPPYAYVLFHALFITVTRRSVALATSAASTAVVALQGSSLVLTTTPAEEAALALCTLPPAPARLGRAWRRVRGEGPAGDSTGDPGPPDPAAGTAALTLLLSLRFLSLVFDEARGLALGLAARGVDWGSLGPGGGVALGGRLVTRLFANLEARAADIAVAMRARGFRGPGGHRVHTASGGAPTSWPATGVALALAVAALARAAVASP